MHGWQSKSTDGPKGGWSCAFGMVAVVTSSANAECNVVLRGVVLFYLQLECSAVVAAVVEVVAVVVAT